jgi:DNA-binding LacI/PurR family transcriptional regulator
VLIRIITPVPDSPVPRPVTARDVAARAGVSQPTVSLVLSGNPTARLSPETRARVKRAARELGYRPNVAARGLARGRSYALGILVPDLRNPFFADVASGAQRVATEEGYAVLLAEAREVEPSRHLEALRARRVDGIIIDAVGASDLDPELLAGLNVVLIDEPSTRWPGVASDALGAGRAAADHLLSLGHRRLAVMGPAIDVHTFRQRERGFISAIRAAGIPLPSTLLQRARPTVGGGQEAMRALLALPERPTGVFCANDLMALGALKACARARVAVPDVMSIVGCDDVELARVVTPELTTIAIPARELGARAARMLARQLDGRGKPVSSSRPLPATLKVRGTSGPAPRDRS